MLAAQIDAANAGIAHNMPIAIAAAPVLKDQIAGPNAQAHDVTASFSSATASEIVTATHLAGDPAAYVTQANAVSTAAFADYDATIGALDGLLSARIASLRQHEVLIFAFVLAMLAIAAGCMIVATRSIAHRLRSSMRTPPPRNS
jgi:hypothetical protein